MKKAKTFILSILLSLTVGGLSALATASNMNIYDKITPPPLAPPGWLFPVVWTVLFILMGISAAIIFTSKSRKKDDALFVYAVSLVLNFSWSIFFFNMQSFIVAFVILVALWLSIIITMIKYFKIKKSAAWLQLPYLLWVTFAGYLNLAIIYLN
jgi:tryptophan-rich sensory protein